MNTRSVLSARILEELNEISTAAKRVKMAWRKAIDKNDDLYFDSVALNLHSFYSMCLNIPNIRPPVISCKLKNDLQDYRSFRHLVRNIHTYNINPEKIKPLVQKLPSLLKCINKDLKLFNKFLQTI